MCSAGTGRTAPGTRTRRWDACTCARPSTSSGGPTWAACAPSLPRCNEIVLDLGGSHSGEHGDGLVRSEFIEGLMGRRVAAAVRGGETGLRPARLDESRQDRRSPAHGRPQPHALPARLRARALRDHSRLEQMGRAGRRRRDVQQQRRLQEVRPGDHVPLLPRHRRREARHARARERPAAGADRAARLRRDALTGDEGGLRPVYRLQGVPARVPCGRGHGPHEGRVPAPLPEETSRWRAGSRARASSADRGSDGSAGPSDQCRRWESAAAEHERAADRHRPAARVAKVVPQALPESPGPPG